MIAPGVCVYVLGGEGDRAWAGDGAAWVLTEPWGRPSQRGAYLPQTYIIQEEMVVSEPVSDKEALGAFIYHLCDGKDTYRLRRRTAQRREWPLSPGEPDTGIPHGCHSQWSGEHSWDLGWLWTMFCP